MTIYTPDMIVPIKRLKATVGMSNAMKKVRVTQLCEHVATAH